MFDTQEQSDPDHPGTEARAREAELREAIAHLNAATARVVDLVGVIDADKSWADHFGCLSPNHLLSWQCGVGRKDASRWVNAGRTLQELPATRAAFFEGRLSLTQVEAISKVATPATDASYVYWASQMTAAQFERLANTARRAQRLQEDRAEEVHRKRFLSTYFDDDGSYAISGRLAAEAGALVDKALERAEDELFAADKDACVTESAGARRADALVHVAEGALASSGERSGADAVQVVVHLTPDALAGAEPTEESRCELEPGLGLGSKTAERLCCDASFVPVLWSKDGNPLDVGRKTRRISPALRRALNARDAHCRFPGCNHRRFKDAHHIRHWIKDGETKPENLVSLCRRHHRLMHEGKCSVVRAADSTFEFFDPWGNPIVARGAPMQARGPTLAERHASVGFQIDSDTCRPDWNADSLTRFALDVILTNHHYLEEDARHEPGDWEEPPSDLSWRP